MRFKKHVPFLTCFFSVCVVLLSCTGLSAEKPSPGGKSSCSIEKTIFGETADGRKIPTGEIAPVAGTVMDFTTPEKIGARIMDVEGRNYDHCYVLNKKKGRRLSYAACLFDPGSGRVMKVYTTQPGVQLYTAKHLSSRFKTKKGSYGPYHAVCLETQHFPDSPNKSAFPETVLRPGEAYKEVTVHVFSVEKSGENPF